MRYLPLSPAEKTKILSLCGVQNFDELVAQIPADLRLKKLLDLEKTLSEPELVRHLRDLAAKNKAAGMQSHLGQGVYDHEWPAVIDQITNRGEFLTAYTPYQPEVSQGTLQLIFEFQSMIAELLGFEVSNASLYDGSTAVLEGILMAARLQNLTQGVVYVSEGLYYRTRQLLETYLQPLGIELVSWKVNPKTFRSEAAGLSPDASGKAAIAVVMQSPNKWGLIENWQELQMGAAKLNSKSVASVSHAHSLALFSPPGSAGIDIAVGEGQALGIPVGFGGPHLGLLACRKKDVRQMPGRLVGATVDSKGQRAFCVTLSTREQHIRREKATSNICSNQNLMATRATMYLTLMGPEGLRKVAGLTRDKAYFARELFRKALASAALEVKVLEGETLGEITLLIPPSASLWMDSALARAEQAGILAGVPVQVPKASGYVQGLSIAFTEKHSKEDVERLVQVLVGGKGAV